MNEIILIGGGGHCHSCIDVIEQEGTYRIAGIVDVPGKTGQEVMGYKILATDQDIPALTREYRYFLITLGMVRISPVRKTLFETVRSNGGIFPAIASPHAFVSPHAAIGEGTILMHGVTVNAGAVIGKNCIINSHALIEHDVIVGDHAHVATGCLVNGGVKIGSGSFLGSGSVCKQYIEIPCDTFIKAQSLIK